MLIDIQEPEHRFLPNFFPVNICRFVGQPILAATGFQPAS
jgi:hypothetical protein